MKKFLYCIILGALLISCQEDTLFNTDDNGNKEEKSEVLTGLDGVITVKLQKEILEMIDNSSNELNFPTGNEELDQYLHSIGAYRIKRVFPYAGKHEERQLEDRLNAWYTVWYDEPEVKVKSAAFTSVFDFVEPVYEPILEEYEVTASNTLLTRNTSVSPFNDPLFSRQWNLFNNGNLTNSIPGADINILPVWTEETGNPDVIVSVVDGGIDIYHEDLIDNLWINKGEIPGNGIDDDNNGYVDDVYGFNFVDETGTIVPHDHGTHVAGVIAAKNNNGIGISSIAGGDGADNSGVKLMSCQIFMKNPDYDPNDPESRANLSTKNSNLTAAAIVYGANNGAVISQNSWGYDIGGYTPEVIKEAIAYFKKQAKSRLMEGGVVLFAASNDNTSYKTYPAAEENVISVAAYAPDFAAAYYTNYGDWVDISAPGGSYPYNGKYNYENNLPTSCVYSTLTSSEGVSRYGYMQGTSMACPHVSGVAALLVSKYGGDHFKADELERRLLTGVKMLNPNNYNIDKYKYKLGNGFLDATVALTDYEDTFVPGMPLFVDAGIERGYLSISLAWKAPEGSMPGDIYSYRLYFSEEEITTENDLSNPQIKKFDIIARYTTENNVLTRVIDGLESGKNYYFAIRSVARNGNESTPAIYKGGISTLPNTAPVINPDIDLRAKIVLAGNDIQEIFFNITDAEAHTWKHSLLYKNQLFVEKSDNGLRIRVFANRLVVGVHNLELVVTDEFGASSSVAFTVEVIRDNPPRLREEVFSVNVKRGGPTTISLSDLIEDEDKTSLLFTLGVLNNDNAQVSLLNDQLTLNPKRTGESELSFTVTDKHNQSVKLKLPIFIYENEGIYSLYPTAVDQTLYVKLGDVIDGPIELRIRNVMGKLALEKTYNTQHIDIRKRTLLVNVASLLPGKYELSLINNGKTYKESFVKR